MKYLFTFLIAISSISIVTAQDYTDYIGAGHSEGIIVISSSEEVGSEAFKTIDGAGMNSRLFETGRFLSQATMGADLDLINIVKNMDYGVWIDQQITEPVTYLQSEVEDIWEEYLDTLESRGYEDPQDAFGPAMPELTSAWWHNNMVASDLIRQKVAFALSEMFVISSNSDLGGEAIAMAHYYDKLLDGAFGNYKDILSEISLHAAMGYYLSHFNNPKAVPEENLHPDENYAREIMQLFSIGLYELNNDGTHQLDNDGNSIPTYDNADIKEMAKIFTGLGPGGINENVWWTDEPYFGLGIFGIDWTVPMAMYEDFHEPGIKVILKNDTIPANQLGLDDIDEAINVLFNHQNVPPFVSYRLIQRLVKSNPTPNYVERIANVFIDNGNGVRGDMAAIIKAILLDEEARNGEYMFEQHSSRLREPLVRHMQITKGLEIVEEPGGRYWHNFDYDNSLKQQILFAPTVFNFFLPNHQPVGDIANSGLVSPEFKIHDTSSSINYFNAAYRWTRDWGELINSGRYFYNSDLVNDDGSIGGWDMYGFGETYIDYEAYTDLADTPELLINELDKVLTHGQLSDEVRQSLRDNLPNISWDGYEYGWERERVRTAIYLITVSPDFAVIR
ncbi:MAG: DUF1800 family protein [Saprospiraceae bacterium]|nr:DUF1800 family protein [Saprospiraceae bacterium]